MNKYEAYRHKPQQGDWDVNCEAVAVEADQLHEGDGGAHRARPRPPQVAEQTGREETGVGEHHHGGQAHLGQNKKSTNRTMHCKSYLVKIIMPFKSGPFR